jgi:hypothetical protein
VLQYDKDENDTASNGKIQSFQEGRKGEWQNKNIKPSAQLL